MNQINSKFGLNSNTLQQITTILAKFTAIDRVVIYGSRAKGNYKNGSDVDLCLFGESIDLHLVYSIIQALDDLLLPYKFDITVYDKISNNELKEHIDRVGIEVHFR